MKRFVFQLATVVATTGLMTLPGMSQSANQGFIAKAMESNYAEVRLGCLAESKAENPQVKDFAQMMVEDHSQALQRMHSMMDASTSDATSNINADTNDNDNNNDNQRDLCQSIASNPGTEGNQMWGQMQLNSKDEDLYNKLSKLSGNAFDREYINAMVDDHRKDVREFEQEAGVTSNDNTDLSREKPEAGVDARSLAREMLPTLQKHLQAAETIQRQLQQ
jgi:putative membrane protein